MRSMTFVSATKRTEGDFHYKTQLGRSIERLHGCMEVDRFRMDIAFENADGLPKVYNRAIEAEILDRSLDNKVYGENWLVFAHDDLQLTDAFLDEKLAAAFRIFDVVGAAGSADFDIHRKPEVWHNSPREKWSGAVEHPTADSKGALGNGEYNYVYFGTTPKRCAVLDGLFMAVDANRLGKLRFDERFDFHFYDMSFSLDANAAGLRVGTANVHMTHMSHGDYRNEGWTRNRDRFLEKYEKRGAK